MVFPINNLIVLSALIWNLAVLNLSKHLSVYQFSVLTLSETALKILELDIFCNLFPLFFFVTKDFVQLFYRCLEPNLSSKIRYNIHPRIIAETIAVTAVFE